MKDATKALSMAMITALALFGLGCGGTSDSTRPHAASVDGHHQMADQHERMADYYEDQADQAVATAPDQYGQLWSLSRTHRDHVERHRDAARTLAASADPDACVGVALEHTETCPLAEYEVMAFEAVDGGVEVLYGGADADTLRSHIRCHLAHAEMMGEHHDDAPMCPLLGEAIDVDVQPDPAGGRVTITSTSEAEQQRLRGLYEESDGTEDWHSGHDWDRSIHSTP